MLEEITESCMAENRIQEELNSERVVTWHQTVSQEQSTSQTRLPDECFMQSAQLDENRTLQLINNLKGCHHLARNAMVWKSQNNFSCSGYELVCREHTETFTFSRYVFCDYSSHNMWYYST